ncbi:MAG: replication-associated recombination protein A [Brotaphodocola sp.]
MDLFDYMRSTTQEKESPLASRMRPTMLDEVVGQKHIIGKDKLLYRAIKADQLGSIIFYGPPGTGKTTLAKVIANTTSAHFRQINATVAGKKDMEEVVNEAKDALGMYGKKTILFVDEIHRFNKSQQDYLLPYVEDGTLILIGATTENPFFEVNGALLSRSRIFELKALEKDAIKELIFRAVNDEKKGMGSYNAEIDDDAAEFLSDVAGGDARAALNAVELGILTTERDRSDGKIHITLDVAQECIQKRAVRYDKDGDNHYDTISAFIKSMRGSDPDAAIYYLARMLYAGEDIKFIARRIMICAAEDVGNADPQALTVAVSAAQAVERIGMPEAQIILAQAVSYVATAPKSNSAVCAINEAMDAVKNQQAMPVPVHLQDAHYRGSAKIGHGVGYRYAHDYPNHYVEQQYLPDGMVGQTFYHPSENGYEKQIREHMDFIHREAKK